MTKATLAWVVAFWAVVDFGVPFVLDIIGATYGRRSHGRSPRAVYVGLATWPPPEMVSLRYIKDGRLRPPGLAGYVIGKALATVLSLNTLWFYALFGAGYLIRRVS
jgi:hypothetical protein